mgnify:CR=1 FL=1
MIVQGNRVVSYQGERYIVRGFYFARNLNGNRDLFYILRLGDSDLRFGRPDGGGRRHRGGTMTAESFGVDAAHED